MSYSYTLPLSVDRSGPARLAADADPLFAAWQLLREARTEPFVATSVDIWRSAVLTKLSKARSSLERHIAQVKSGTPPLDRLTGPALEQDLSDHTHLIAALDGVLKAYNTLSESPLWYMVGLTERIIEAEIQFARHSNRLAAFLESAPQAPGAATGHRLDAHSSERGHWTTSRARR